ncbi:MAG TPA: regulatory protein RecX [Phycisphaerales bacterium]|nr:regulatory protein RecX [Phycisphaerales bacterium]
MKNPQHHITDIRAKPDQPSRRKILVGKRVVAELGEDEIDRLGLHEGTRWTEMLAEKVQSAMQLDKAQREAMRIIAKRPRTSKEVSMALIRKGFGEATVDSAVRRLVKDGWLNDTQFAHALADETTRRKPASRRLVSERLKKRGVKSTDVDAAIRDTIGSSSESDEAVKLAKLLMKRTTGLDLRTKARRIAGGLARRGFDEETVLDVLERLKLTVDDA